MAMDLRDPNVWISHLLENLPEEKLASALKDDNPNWEYIDGEIVKLGSLAHSQLDIPELQRRGLVILASESKDFRLLAHLLITLQHAGDPHLALRLLALYVEHYWAVAAPQNMAHKKRFASQVIKRFETGIEVFSQNAATAQRDALSGELAKLAQCWQSHNAPELAQATDDLFALYQRAFNRAAPAPVPTPAASGSSPQTTATSEEGLSQGSPVQWLSPQHCGGGRSIRCSSNCYRLTTPLRAQQRCGWPHLNSKTMSAGCNNFLIPPRYSRWKPGCR